MRRVARPFSGWRAHHANFLKFRRLYHYAIELKRCGQERESSEAFVNARTQHPAIESAIHALQVHGLNRCRDRGIGGFDRYIA